MQIDVLEVVNTMPVPKEQKEELILTMFDLEPKDYTFIYEGDKIKHIRYNDSIKQMKITIKLDEEGSVNE